MRSSPSILSKSVVHQSTSGIHTPSSPTLSSWWNSNVTKYQRHSPTFLSNNQVKAIHVLAIFTFLCLVYLSMLTHFRTEIARKIRQRNQVEANFCRYHKNSSPSELSSPTSALSSSVFSSSELSPYFVCKDKVTLDPFTEEVIFGMPTYKKDHYLSYLMKNSWGKHIPSSNLIMYTETYEPMLDPVVSLENPYAGRKTVRSTAEFNSDGVWKTFPMFKDMYERFPTHKWYIKVDADAFISVPNLMRALKKYNPEDEIILSGIWTGPQAPRPWFQDEQHKRKTMNIKWPSGALYAVSHGLLKKMVEKNMEKECPLYEWEDFTFSICASKLANPRFVDYLNAIHQKKRKEEFLPTDMCIHNVKTSLAQQLYNSTIEGAIDYLYHYFYIQHYNHGLPSLDAREEKEVMARKKRLAVVTDNTPVNNKNKKLRAQIEEQEDAETPSEIEDVRRENEARTDDEENNDRHHLLKNNFV